MSDTWPNRVTAQMTVEDIVARFPRAMEVFLRHAMTCGGCYISRFHPLSYSAEEFGVDLDRLVAEINDVINEERPKQ